MNSFSVHNIVGLLVMLAAAVGLYVSNWRRPGRSAGVLFGHLAACSSAACLLMFLVDNVVPEGVDARAVVHGAQRTALLLRLAYALGLVATAIELHFVFLYCRPKARLWRRIVLTYAVFLGLVPGIWLGRLVQVRPEPVATTGSWVHAVPWMPEIGQLSVAFVVLWLGVQVYAQVRLWQVRRQETGEGPLGIHTSVIQLALVIQGGGAVISALNGWLGHAGPDPVPLTSAVAGVVVLLAMRSSQRRRVAMQQRRARTEHA